MDLIKRWSLPHWKHRLDDIYGTLENAQTNGRGGGGGEILHTDIMAVLTFKYSMWGLLPLTWLMYQCL